MSEENKTTPLFVVDSDAIAIGIGVTYFLFICLMLL